MQEQLAVLHRLAQPVLELDLLRDARIDARRVEQVALAGFLRALERRLGIAKQRAGVGTIVGKYRNAGLGGDADLVPPDPQGPPEPHSRLPPTVPIFHAP